MATVVLLGTFDTKGEEYAWLRDRLHEVDCETLLVDAGVFSDGHGIADVLPAEVAAAAGEDLEELRAAKDRGASMGVMARGSAVLVRQLLDEGRVHGFHAIGGSGGSSVAAQAMQAMPVGAPKVLVSTMASGDVRPYVGVSDVTLMYSVVDVAGINSISRRVFGNVEWTGSPPPLPDQGLVDIYLDGKVVKRVDTHSVARATQQVVFSSGALKKGQHTFMAVKALGDVMRSDQVRYTT